MLNQNKLQKLKVSVIICCYSMNRYKDVLEAVQSVLSQTFKPYEVVVAVDHTLEVFDKLKSDLPKDVKLVLSKGTPGLSETRNIAINAASGEIIAFIDDDALAEVNWLENLLPAFNDPQVVAVGGEALPLWPKGHQPYWFPLDFDFVIGCTNHKRLILQANGVIRNVTGSNMAFRKDVFDKAGLWETKLGRCETGNVKFNPSGGEEAELCLRIKNQIPDGSIIFNQKAIVHHKVDPKRATLKYVFNYSFREGITRAMMKKIVSRYKSRPLAAENLYLQQLLKVAIPRRIARFYQLKPIAQVGVLMVNLSLVALGYTIGVLQYRKESI